MTIRLDVDELTDRILQHLAGDPDLLQQLMAESGLSPADLRQAVGQPGFGAALLDFVCADDARLLACAAATGWTAQRIAHVRAALEAGALS